jgi:hypothetical protein
MLATLSFFFINYFLFFCAGASRILPSIAPLAVEWMNRNKNIKKEETEIYRSL